MMLNQNYLKLVQPNLLFNSVSESFLKSFIKPKNFFTAKEGTLIYSFDDEAKDIYLVIEGEVKIKFCDDRNIIYKHLSDFFGEKEILEKSNRVSFAIANKDCKLYRIEAEELSSLSKDNNVTLNKVFNENCEELSECLEQLS
jgi:CRP-like cAMP-binding protein